MSDLSRKQIELIREEVDEFLKGQIDDYEPCEGINEMEADIFRIFEQVCEFKERWDTHAEKSRAEEREYDDWDREPADYELKEKGYGC